MILLPLVLVVAVQPIGSMHAASLGVVSKYAVGQAPMPQQAITAAKNAKASVEGAQKKNSDALDPPSPAPPAPAPAQQPPAGSTQGHAQPTAAPPAPEQSPAGQSQGGFTYDPAGRRDPFVSLMFRGGEPRPSMGARPAGISGLLIGEIAVKGVMRAKSGLIALVQAPDNKTYIVHQGDRLMDGSVKSVAQDAVVFSQDVNDPLSLVKQREVRKTIRPETR